MLLGVVRRQRLGLDIVEGDHTPVVSTGCTSWTARWIKNQRYESPWFGARDGPSVHEIGARNSVRRSTSSDLVVVVRADIRLHDAGGIRLHEKLRVRIVHNPCADAGLVRARDIGAGPVVLPDSALLRGREVFAADEHTGHRGRLTVGTLSDGAVAEAYALDGVAEVDGTRRVVDATVTVLGHLVGRG